MKQFDYKKPLILTILTVLAALSGYFAVLQLTKPPDLEPPAAQIPPSPENLDAVLALGHSGQQAFIRKSIKVPSNNTETFKKHLEIAALQQGWFAYTQSPGVKGLIMPAEELPMLDNLQQDPMGWITDRRATEAKAQAPSSLNLVIVHLDISYSNRLAIALWVCLIIATIFLTPGFAIVAVYSYRDAWRYSDR